MPGRRRVVAVVAVVVVVVVHGVVAAGQGAQACGGQGCRHLVMMVAAIGDEACVLMMVTIGLGHIRGRGVDARLPGGGGRGGRAGGGHREAVVETGHGHRRGGDLGEAGVVRLGLVSE